MSQQITEQQAKQAFQRQLTEAKDLGLKLYPIRKAEDLINVPKAWEQEITISMYLEVFLEQHPHLRGARNLPAIRRAIKADLKSKGMI
jgi:hypothetical protein